MCLLNTVKLLLKIVCIYRSILLYLYRNALATMFSQKKKNVFSTKFIIYFLGPDANA